MIPAYHRFLDAAHGIPNSAKSVHSYSGEYADTYRAGGSSPLHPSDHYETQLLGPSVVDGARCNMSGSRSHLTRGEHSYSHFPRESQAVEEESIDCLRSPVRSELERKLLSGDARATSEVDITDGYSYICSERKASPTISSSSSRPYWCDKALAPASNAGGLVASRHRVEDKVHEPLPSEFSPKLWYTENVRVTLLM
jgi:hypothetical protein